MASSKKTVAEKKGKETKPTRKPNKKITTGSTRKSLGKNYRSCNGTVHDAISVPSSSLESQEDDERERGKGASATKRAGSATSKKGKQKRREEEVNNGVDQEEEEEVGEKEVNDAKMHRFPMNRIKTIVRSEDSDFRINQEALFLVNRATEKFLEQFTKDAQSCCVQDGKKSLGYKHLSSVVSKRRRYDFLSDFVPEKIKAQDALAEREVTKTEAG